MCCARENSTLEKNYFLKYLRMSLSSDTTKGFEFDIGRHNGYNIMDCIINWNGVSEKHIGGSNEILISKRSSGKMGHW